MKLKTLSIAMMGLVAPGLVAADELIDMQKNANNWVMPAGNYANQRYSELTQITKDNVKDLNMAWTALCTFIQRFQTSFSHWI
jgi:glucose dehydrogenase